jgi:prepilin-type N-terminal cleavage/methylation domain-containing protein
MTMRRHLVCERGFTLTELLIATAVAAVVMAGLLVIQTGGQQAYLMGSNRVETQQSARVALDLMTRELRSAQSVTTLASATDITFVDEYGSTIRYSLSGSTLNRTADGTTTALTGGVQALAMTYYSVYDVSTATYTTTASAALVKVIKISLTTKTEETVTAGTPADERTVLESTVMLRLALS